MQECAICYEDQDSKPFFFNCVVCEEGKCCFRCYDKLKTPKCPVCQTEIASVLTGMYMFFFTKFQLGVHEKNAKLLTGINRFSPLVAYLKEHRHAFERSEEEEDAEDEDEESTDDKDTVQYDEYYDIVRKEFPQYPFEVSLGYKTLLRLDEPFCDNDPEMITIRDTRVLRDTFGFYTTVMHDEEVADCELDIYRRHDDCPITLRQVITEMGTSPHYENGYVIQDDHRFLVGFATEAVGDDDDPVYSPSFGS